MIPRVFLHKIHLSVFLWIVLTHCPWEMGQWFEISSIQTIILLIDSLRISYGNAHKWMLREPSDGKPILFQVMGWCRRHQAITRANFHDDVIKWKHFPRNWPFVRGIHRSPVNSPHKGQWRGALMFSLICVWINDWVNNREAGDLRRHLDHYGVSVMLPQIHVAIWCQWVKDKPILVGLADWCLLATHHHLPRFWSWSLVHYCSSTRQFKKGLNQFYFFDFFSDARF